MADLSGLSTNFFPTPKEGFTTTTSGSIDSSTDTEIPLNSVSGLTNGNVFTGIIDPGNAKERAFTGVVDTGGSQITNVVFTTGSNATHTAGATVVDYVTSTHVAQMTKGILVDHSQAGAHEIATNYDPSNPTLETQKWVGVSSAVNEITITNAATGNFPTISATGEADTGIDFENSEGEEILKLDAVASAVNEITITNAATAGIPTISASGGDTDISIRTKAKGAGTDQAGRPVSFYATTAQSISSSAATTDLTTYTEVFDYGSNFNHTTGIFTAPYAGVYYFSATMSYTDPSNATSRNGIFIIVNSTSIAAQTTHQPATNHDPIVNCSAIYTLAANDTVKVAVYQDGGASETLVTPSNFNGYLVGRTD